jgi:hypothetical protein
MAQLFEGFAFHDLEIDNLWKVDLGRLGVFEQALFYNFIDSGTGISQKMS